MAAGYEAKARITVDTSQLLRATREAARSIGTLTTATREATAALNTMERSGRTAAQAMRPFANMMQTLAADSRQADTANQQLSRGLRENATAFSTASESAQRFQQNQSMTAAGARRLAREIVDTDERLSQVRRAMDMGVNSAGQLDVAYTTLRQELQRLRQTYDSLGTGQQQAVRSQMNLITAQRDASQASRDADAAVRELNKQRMEQVRITVRAAEQEAKAAAAADRAAQKQRELSASAQQAAQQQQRLAQTGGAVAAGLDRSTRSVGGLDGSLWALRSSVGEVEGMLYGLRSTAIRVTQSMWQNFSSQEMAIAQISRVSQATAMELDEITNSVRQMSREIPIAFNELAEITKLGSQVGIANQYLSDFTETVALFAATSEVSADETATLLARISQMADVPETEVMNLGSAIAFLGSNSAATDAEILNTIESISTIGNQAGMSETAIVGLGGAMASLRIRPELARGAMQRVFNHLEASARGSGEAMEMLTDITGQTQQGLIDLLDSGEHTDEFFLSIMEGLNGMYREGTNLVPVLREMGIVNTRDVDVLARLAANWDVVESSVRDASGAYQDANYLYAESDRIFNTLRASVQLMSNAWQEFLFEAGAAIAPFVTKVVEGTTAVIRFAQEIGAAPLVGWAAVALAAAAAVGTLGIAVTTVTRGYIAWRSILLATSSLFGAKTAAVNANTASLVGNTAATTTNTGATTANSGVKAANAAASTTAAAANTGLAASATAASRAMMAMALANPATTVLVALGAVLSLATAMDTLGGSTERAQRKLLDAHDAHINAAGGITALSQAIDQDTASWRAAQIQAEENIESINALTGTMERSASDVVRYSQYRTGSSEDMSEADRIAAEEAQGLADRQKDLADTLGTSAERTDTVADALDRVQGATIRAQGAASEADNSIGKINQGLTETAMAADESQYAIGLATRQWAAMSMESAVLESGLLDSAEAFEVFKDSGADLNIAITKELQNAGDGAAYLRNEANRVRDEFSGWDSFLQGLNEFTHNMVWDGWRPFSSEAIEAADSIDHLAENLDATSLSIQEATRQTELMEDVLIRMPDGTTATIQQLQELSGEGAELAAVAMTMEQEISDLGISVQDLNDAFVSFMDPLSAWDQALATANEQIDAQNEIIRENNKELEDNEQALLSQYDSLLEVSGGFGLYLDELEKMSQSQMEWGQNLMQLADDVPPHVLAGLTEMGSEGAEIVQGLVDASDEEVARFVELWDQGAGDTMDTFSIMFSDFLVLAADSGDTAGVDFITGLMDEVAQGDISFRDAVDQMTEYAEDEFQNADTENEPNLELTKALRDLIKLIDRIETDVQNADTENEPTLNTSGFWSALSSFWTDVVEWWGGGPKLNVRPNVSGATQFGSQGRKDGGWVSGPGGPRGDKIPTMLSDKEFVVNARSAREFGPLLEYINSQRSSGGKQIMTPNFVPDNILTIPRRPLSAMREAAPDSVSRSMNTVRRPQQGGWNITVNNQYPQAEPTSVTVNRALAYTAALDGVD